MFPVENLCRLKEPQRESVCCAAVPASNPCLCRRRSLVKPFQHRLDQPVPARESVNLKTAVQAVASVTLIVINYAERHRGIILR